MTMSGVIAQKSLIWSNISITLYKMEALILAAGLGSRLRPLTSDTPKAMVRYQGKEIISYQIEALDSLGIKKIHIVSG